MYIPQILARVRMSESPPNTPDFAGQIQKVSLIEGIDAVIFQCHRRDLTVGMADVKNHIWCLVPVSSAQPPCEEGKTQRQ